MKGIAMRNNQRGMTLIGFIIGLIVVCFFAYMGMVIGPAYSEYYGVKKAMDFVARDASPSATDPGPIINALDRQFTVGYVETIHGKDVKLVREKRGNLLKADYEVRKSFIYNIDFAIKFQYAVPLGGGKGVSG